MSSLSSSNNRVESEDPLFLERLDVFLEKSLDDLREFARREGRDFEPIRLKAAEWHSRYLFSTREVGSSGSGSVGAAQTIINDVLEKTSRSLDTLLEVAGRQSLLLVVNPTDETDDGFLGGTSLGREYWHGMRNGFRSFKDFCKRSSGIHSNPQTTGAGMTSTGTKQTPAGILKNNLYADMRSKLRAISNVRNAEMKWTKPEKLSVYGVALEGWPKEIDYKNPSRMSFQEISTIMKLLQDNVLYFRPLRGGSASVPHYSTGNLTSNDMSWALNDDNPSAL